MDRIQNNKDKDYILNEHNILDKPEDLTFAKYIKSKRKEVRSPSGKEGISIGEHAEMLGLSQEMFRKILNKQKPNQSRDCVIAICAAIGMDVDDTNTALRLYQYYPQLDNTSPRDRLIIEVLDGDIENTIDIQEINNRLTRHGYKPLDIIEHRHRNIVQTAFKPSRFEIMKKSVRTSTDSLVYGDQYQSLATEYDLFRYHCWGIMYIRDSETNQKYKLTADTSGNCYLEKYPWPEDEKSPFETFKSPKETGIFQDLFLELVDSAKNEKHRMESFLNDTKNYRERISARIYNRKIYIFCEEYNYAVPEFNEYYLFEYIDGGFRLTVSHGSLFMQKYLTSEQYSEHYGNLKCSQKEVYSSIEEIDAAIQNTEISQQEIEVLKLRKRAFKHFKEKTDDLLEKLKARRIFVRNLRYIWDDIDRVCEFYGVTKEFKCKLDDEIGEMMFAENHEAKFTLSDGNSVLITIDDLYRAFELGFEDIADICEVKNELGSIEAMLF